MKTLKSLCSAFLMYSRIPVPQVEWSEENRRYALCFFPLVGVVIGGIELLWYFVSSKLEVGELMFASVCVAAPIFVTGGIHMDGYCDVHDAAACLGSREKLLEVMKDSRIGAFAAINLAVYIVMQMGAFSEVKSFSVMSVASLAFILSRAISGLCAVTLKSAKSDGTLQSFSKAAHRNVTVIVLTLYIILTAAAMLAVDMSAGLGAVVGAAVASAYYVRFSYKRFGGITGDLAGYFLQICELSELLFAVAAHLITRGMIK